MDITAEVIINIILTLPFRGQVFALLGHSGAGKSTTIDLILGLKCTDEGNATILGMDPLRCRCMERMEILKDIMFSVRFYL